jgi:hypothetical protein
MYSELPTAAVTLLQPLQKSEHCFFLYVNQEVNYYICEKVKNEWLEQITDVM